MSGHASSPPPPSSPSNSDSKSHAHDPVRDMAVQIYIKLASDALNRATEEFAARRMNASVRCSRI